MPAYQNAAVWAVHAHAPVDPPVAANPLPPATNLAMTSGACVPSSSLVSAPGNARLTSASSTTCATACRSGYNSPLFGALLRRSGQVDCFCSGRNVLEATVLGKAVASGMCQQCPSFGMCGQDVVGTNTVWVMEVAGALGDGGTGATVQQPAGGTSAGTPATAAAAGSTSSSASGSTSVVVVAVVFSLLIVIAGAAVVFFLYRMQQKRKKRMEQDETDEREVKAMLSSMTAPGLSRPSSTESVIGAGTSGGRPDMAELRSSVPAVPAKETLVRSGAPSVPEKDGHERWAKEWTNHLAGLSEEERVQQIEWARQWDAYYSATGVDYATFQSAEQQNVFRTWRSSMQVGAGGAAR
ncbi:hypothetical protein HK101_008889 [Irineochytrium annulatum]|nr:hypothetical protein HK101_008889 [Irineochytrium annulatum]